MLNIRNSMWKKWNRVYSLVLDIKIIIWYEKYFYLYWILACLLNSSQWKIQEIVQSNFLFFSQCISVLTFKYLFWFHWDKCSSSDKHMICIICCFHPAKGVYSDKSWDTKDETSSLNLAGAKKQNQNHNGTGSKMQMLLKEGAEI